MLSSALVDRQVKSRGLLYRYVSRIGTLEDTVDLPSALSKYVSDRRTIGHERSSRGKVATFADQRESMLSREIRYSKSMLHRERPMDQE
jgi:hypothetical protein